eukprot:6911781-Alexandrium_andersonii.AAC.1
MSSALMHPRPLGRFVIYIEAVLAMAVYICTARQGRPEAAHARGWLSWLDEERLVVIAMLADAGDA